ncbi:MAG: glycoside hydrolase family 5 protein [Comamonadaceae bacterium]|nr:MAG: glycoside hydrolase family 5 protein [Comamonadaceae bacterium]
MLPSSRYSRRQLAVIGLSWATMLASARAATGSRAKGRMPFLRGVNFGGLTHEAWSQPPALPAYDYYLRQKKMNVVRLNFTWEWVQPRLQAPLDVDHCRVIDQQIKQATSAGSYVILEFHNFGRRTVDGVSLVIGESARCSAADFADGWARMAQRWGRNERVIFGLMNEPHDQSIEVLLAVSNRAIAAIRATGATNLIMVSGNDWNSMAWQAGSDNQKWMLRIRDEADNFCFDVHHYFDDWSAGQTPNVRADALASMAAFTAWAKAHRMRAFCGEFGCGVNRRGLDACRELLHHIEANPDVFIGWAWWGAGGPWQPDYVFLLDPYASVTSPTNPDPEGAVSWDQPVDRPQMKLLQEFLPRSATPFNGWLIEVDLAPKVGAFYRKGDYRGPATRCFLGGDTCAAEWIDSGPVGATARSTSDSPPTQQRDGSVAFAAGKASSLETKLPAAMPIRKAYAMVRAAPQVAPGLRLSGTATRAGQTQGLDLPPAGATAAGGTMALTAFDLAGTAFNAVGLAITAGASPGSTAFDILVLRAPVTDDEKARIQGRLFWDNGLAHALPRDHPYRERPPSTRSR